MAQKKTKITGSTIAELYTAIYSAKKELFAFNLQRSTAQMRQTHLIASKKKDIARLMAQLSVVRNRKA